MADEKRWYTTMEVATLLHITDRHVRRLCRGEGEPLVCRKEGKQLLVDADSVEAFLQKQPSISEETFEKEHEVSSIEDSGDMGFDNQENEDVKAEDIKADVISNTGESEPASADIAPVNKAEDDIPVDIKNLVEKLQVQKQTFLEAQEKLWITTDALYERLCWEYRHNRAIEKQLQDIIEKLNLPPKPRRRKFWMRFF